MLTVAQQGRTDDAGHPYTGTRRGVLAGGERVRAEACPR
jgi:hypothetical protein